MRNQKKLNAVRFAAQARASERLFNDLLDRGSVRFEALIDRVDEHLALERKSVIQLAAQCGYTNPGTRKSWWYRMRHNVLRRNYNPQWRTVVRLSLATGMTIPELFEEY